MSVDDLDLDLVFRRKAVQQRPLMSGTKMYCPRCKKRQDILTFVPLALIEEFSAETVTIYKCSLCRWLFAPHPSL